ncbi:hypothetical protein [Rothia sp. ND6WE1A]|uniref:hypothetical protein n=1 Tax=Rothia sp. ND6WE1A TaxID=1848190 RepID=UPI00350E96BC
MTDMEKSLMDQYPQDLLGVFGDPGLVVEKEKVVFLRMSTANAILICWRELPSTPWGMPTLGG